MINELYKLRQTNSLILHAIKNFDQLIGALRELDGLIEMKSVKSSIISQLRFLIIKHLQSTEAGNSVFEGHMLHTVIYGPPGVGKTKIGCILAKIWMSLTLINLSQSSTPDLHDLIITKLEQRNRTWLEKLEILQQQSLAQQDCYNIFRGEIKKLSENHRFLTPAQKDLVCTTFNDGSKYLETCLKIVTEEIHREKPTQDKLFGPSLTTTGVNTEALISAIRKLKPPSANPVNLSSIKIVSRPDFVAEYLGQTAIKTLDLLKANIGKVLFIDEAYSLINSDRDSYGMEALTVLNQFMSEHPNEIVIIFAGYKELMEKTIFERQPGLKRRCTWIFEVTNYTPAGLSRIFRTQLAEHGWTVSDDVELVDFFAARMPAFPAFGGDTFRLSFYCKLAFANTSFTKFVDSTKKNLDLLREDRVPDLSTLSVLSDPTIIKVDTDTDENSFVFSKSIDADILETAFKLYQENRIKEDTCHLSMYC